MGIRDRFGYAVAICIAGALPAVAAELPVNAPPIYYPYPALAPAVLFSWTSCYLGGHVGGAFTDNEMTGTFSVPVPGPFGFITPVPVASTLPIDFGSSGVLVGGQVGCNYQFASRWVIGFEGDFSWANVSGTTQQTNGVTFTAPILLLPTFVSATGTLSAKTDFIGTATARFGYALGPIGQGLIYGKGGAAWVANRYNFNGQVQTTVCTTVQAAQCATVAPFSPIFNWDGRETRIGWTVGVGVEWAMWDNWSTKIEYDYLDFGTQTATLTDPRFGPANINVRERINQVKFGVNYRFGPPLPSSY